MRWWAWSLKQWRTDWGWPSDRHVTPPFVFPGWPRDKAKSGKGGGQWWCICHPLWLTDLPDNRQSPAPLSQATFILGASFNTKLRSKNQHLRLNPMKKKIKPFTVQRLSAKLLCLPACLPAGLPGWKQSKQTAPTAKIIPPKIAISNLQGRYVSPWGRTIVWATIAVTSIKARCIVNKEKD